MDQSGKEIPVTLIIKAPNQKYSDQTISYFLNWTVGKLKTHLSTSRTPPSSPEASTCKENHEAFASRSSSSSDHLRSTTPSSSQETLSLATGSSSEGLRQRALPQAHTNRAPSHQFPHAMQENMEHQFPRQAAAPAPAYPALSPLQMLWWQQVYAQQYYLQYQAAVSAQATSGPSPAQPPASQPLNVAHVPGEEPSQAPNLENRAANENVPRNAKGGPALNEDDFN
ncbi:Homocysteine-responsive endoplasmic reticulum-resident ubiquitin-like domain member 2 protein [Heterocephalus glaber]|uniref:Homocysteine-responsive endoplasmic reticulum-resident ubiquitin-like domain member 2 protein n=1 Tax=Heterocephalus glaber TaxID=10181 RepID=G5ALR8_HETGA|nr:Homocysteine-responsive endoplasmic reticulum-resident ubiquitin-like domain member 2 protein [Heterocephalus glaber]